MSVLEELRALDPRDPGRWPLGIRIGAVAIWFLVIAFVLGYAWVWQTKDPELQAARGEEHDAARRVSQQARQGQSISTSTSSS